MRLASKNLEVPEGGWTAETFARDGRALIMAIDRVARLTQAKAGRHVAAIARSIFNRQISNIIQRVLARAGTRSVKAESIVLNIEDHEALWAQAIADVLAEEGIAAQVELVPPIQSVMAQGYAKVSVLLGHEVPPDAGQRFVSRSGQIAERIGGINETTRKVIETKVRQATQEGLTINETAEKVRREMEGVSRARANTIARTELNNAWTEGAAQSFKESSTITHLSVIGCEAREAKSPHYNGQSTCNYPDLPIAEVDAFLAVGFHPNHTGTMIPSRLRRADGTVEVI